MIVEPAWLGVAKREARWGVEEIPGPTDHNPRILSYHQATSLRATADEVPWCASFVGWCLRESGWLSTGSAAARSYLEWGIELEAWAHGAIAVLARSHAQLKALGRAVKDSEGNYYPGHVGFLVAEPTNSEVMVLSGNQANAVNVRPYPRVLVLSVRWANRRV